MFLGGGARVLTRFHGVIIQTWRETSKRVEELACPELVEGLVETEGGVDLIVQRCKLDESFKAFLVY